MIKWNFGRFKRSGKPRRLSDCLATLKVLHLDPTDVVVIELQEPVSGEQSARIAAHLERVLGHRTVVLERGAKVSVVRVVADAGAAAAAFADC